MLCNAMYLTTCDVTDLALSLTSILHVEYISCRQEQVSRIPYPPVNARVLAKRQVIVVKVFDAFFKTLFQHSAEQEIRYA